jgi:hypothetical protein
MLNMLGLLVVILNSLFGFEIPLLLTKQGTSKKSYLKPRLGILYDYSKGGNLLLDSGTTSYIIVAKNFSRN